MRPWELLGQTCTPEASDMRLEQRTLFGDSVSSASVSRRLQIFQTALGLAGG